MHRHTYTGALRRGIALLMVVGACGKEGSNTDGQADQSSAVNADATPASGARASSAPAELTAASLDAYQRGITKETELVRAAQTRASTASTPQERGDAIQAQWEDQTIPEGARSAGLAPDAYREVRRTVHQVFRTLDFQGKIDGPMQMDTARATPEMRKQLASDPFAELSPSSSAALRERMDRLVPLWVEYVKLTAVAG
jgi:hypothetical protein